MAQRARYTGPFPAVDVRLPSGKFVTVERGKWLPEEHDGEKIPAALRDELLERGENEWSAVEASTTTKGKE